MSSTELKRTLGPLSLWGLGVGYVISGEYFGWNLGLSRGGTYGMLLATLVVTLMYVCFVLSYAELACAIPRAGGAFVYAERAFGPRLGLLTGVSQFVEFVFAPPAIAMAIAAYLNQRWPQIDTRLIATIAYVIFTALNAWGVRQAARFELFVTVLAVGELLLFMLITAPHVELRHLQEDAWPNGWSGAFACLPFAIWFYLAIEGVANAAEETQNPQRHIIIGFVAAIATLVFLALGVFICATGVAGWHAIVFLPGSHVESDAPLPLALARVVSKDTWIYDTLISVGLLGLIASFHGIIMAAARATLEFGRRLPALTGLAKIHPKTQTPIHALFANMLIGWVAIMTGRTSEIITLSCFGALGLYIASMASLLRLRRIEPQLTRPYRAIFYPWFPIVALVLATACLVALTIYNRGVATIFAIMLLIAALAISFRKGRNAFP